jgi:hypothetical protein
MNNIVLSGLVKRRDEDQRLSVRHPPHRTPPIVYRFALNKAGNARWQISSKIAVARAPRRVSPSTVPWRPIAEGPPSFDGPRQRHPRDLGRDRVSIERTPSLARHWVPHEHVTNRSTLSQCGVSKLHPDPVAACEAAEAERRAAR